MPQQTLDAWAGRVRLLNTYGVTECTVYQAAKVLTPGSCRRQLGQGLPGVELYLARGSGDDPLEPVGSGEMGELWIGGCQVGLGYLRRPQLMAERFKGQGSKRLFRSGDLASSTGWWRGL